MDVLRKLLEQECDYRMSDRTAERFFGLMTEMRLTNNEPLIPYGKLDNNAYIVGSGIIRHAYFDGAIEKTFGFSSPGTLIMSYHSLCMHTPSVFQLESCGESVVMKVARGDLDKLFRESRDFANWMYSMSLFQLYAWEMKATLINGSAEERLEALMKNRPEIMRNVSSRIIASYIGINQPYLSRLKRQILKKSKK